MSDIPERRCGLSVKALMITAVFMLSVSCASPPPVLPDLPAPVVESRTETFFSRESGTAGWHGKELHGKKNARGEHFDMFGISAAHRTLPLGTSLRVTNLANSRSIVAIVTVRGPLVRGRIVDLSYGAALELGFIEHGVTPVLIEYAVDESEVPVYTLHGALYKEKENADHLKDRLQATYGKVIILPQETNYGPFHQVIVGVYPNREKAEASVPRLALEGLEPVVIRKDR
jgi:rare lipoprotein A